MNDPTRAVMQMALEAFCKFNQLGTYDDEITALREALAQPQGEPVAWVHKAALHWISDAGDSACIGTSLWKTENEEFNVPLYTTPPSVEAMRIETLEKAAQLCDEIVEDIESMGWASECAAAIRSMK